jgi:hypothetical protein
MVKVEMQTSVVGSGIGEGFQTMSARFLPLR